MKKILLLALMLFLILCEMITGSSYSVFSQSSNTSSSLESVNIHGAGVAICVFHPDAINYQPNAWEIIDDLGINVIRVWGGVEGNIWRIHINDYPEEWAQNLDAFLTEADEHEVKVIFHSLGNKYGNLFGIVSPGISGANATPLDEAKEMIDKLAGENIIEHNFITDPRVLGWRTSNEVDISDEETLQWNLELCDYIRTNGGKAWLSSPEYEGSRAFHLIEPLVRGHVDYLELHHYPVETFNNLGRGYEGFYEAVKEDLSNIMIDGRGNYSMNQLILGEFGIWKGLKAQFTDEERGFYYEAILDAARDIGLVNILFHDLFSVIDLKTEEALTPNYGVVDVYGNYYPYVADVIKEAYSRLLDFSVTNSSAPDISIANDTVTEVEVEKGAQVEVEITFVNQGEDIEYFNVTCYYHDQEIDTIRVNGLSSGESEIVTFNWDIEDTHLDKYQIKIWTDSEIEIAEPIKENSGFENKSSDFYQPAFYIATAAAIISGIITIFYSIRKKS